METGTSRIELTATQFNGREAIDFDARVLWNERACRLKLIFGGLGGQLASATCDVPGGVVMRKPCGEMPAGRWVQAGPMGFASDALYNFDFKTDALSATVCRASRYAADEVTGPEEKRWHPSVDQGELKFRFIVAWQPKNLPALAAELEQPAVVLPVPAAPGSWPRMGSLFEISPPSMRLIFLRKDSSSGQMSVCLQNTGKKTVDARATWLGRKIRLGSVPAATIKSFNVS